MMRTVLIDMRDCRIQILHYFYGQNQIRVFATVVILGSRFNPFGNFLSKRAPPDLDTGILKFFKHPRQEPGGNVPMDRLSAELPEVTWERLPESLTATFTERYTTEELNAAVLRVLLEAGVGILEIQRGSGLESEYLRMASDQPPKV